MDRKPSKARKKKRSNFLLDMIHVYGFRTGAEIGTGAGNLARELLYGHRRLKLIQVGWYPIKKKLPGSDEHFWDSYGAREAWLKVLEPFKSRVTIIEKPSVEAAKEVKNNSLDFIFIDAEHTYECAKEDIAAWVPKVKKGGLISGHDFNTERFPGVCQAVEEAFGDDFKTTYDHVWFTFKE